MNIYKWKSRDGNWSLILGKGLVKVNINWRMVKPSGWDVWINGENIKEGVEDLEEAKDIAIHDIEHRIRILVTQLKMNFG